MKGNIAMSATTGYFTEDAAAQGSDADLVFVLDNETEVLITVV